MAARVNFGPRYGDSGADWVCPDGSPADDEDVGLEATIDEDGATRIAIGPKGAQQEWELTPAERRDLIGLLDPDLVYIDEIELSKPPKDWPRR